MSALPGVWISGFTAARCNECGGLFDMSTDRSCPKGDGGEAGWTPANSTRASQEISRLRDELTIISGGLIQIARGKHSIQFKADLAARLLERITHKTQTPAVPQPALAQKGV